MVPEMTPRDELIHKLAAAQQLLIEAKAVAVKANSLAVNVPEVQRMDSMSKEVSDLMRAVSRMRW